MLNLSSIFLQVVSKSNLFILTLFCLFYLFPKQDDTAFISDTNDESSSWPNTRICD